ncbi:hypothetical protein [Streptomyces lavendulae]|uniref:hypothetical protein n=1 Tax=Streptomyces lavendulae TaxID=1914 RepID=UPI0038065842
MTVPPELEITLHDSLLPATAATYHFKASHVLRRDGEHGEDIDVAPDRLPATEHPFVVKAVQFNLAPAYVHAQYPAPGASGDYERTLPHITLNRSILPWERDVAGRSVPSRAPWLALLLFREGELPDDPTGEGLTVTRPVSELREPVEPGVFGPRVVPEDPAADCQTIDVPVAEYAELLPREDEMDYLAHLRQVTPPLQLLDDGEILTEGDYAVLTTNRFPRAEGNYCVHLASLEGHQAYLGGDLPEGALALRVCSLYSWTFTCNPKSSLDAAGLLQGLVAPGHEDPEELALRLPPSGAPARPDDEQRYALARLRRGYVPVSYRLLTGENTFAWYRGPFTPVTAPPVPLPPDVFHTTADHALIYEREHGLFDVSYAAAWTLGRAMALSDPEYSADLVRARRELANREATLAALGRDPLRAALDPDARPAQHAFDELSSVGFAETLLQSLNAPQLPPRGRRTAAPGPGLPPIDDPRHLSLLHTTADQSSGRLAAWLDQLALLHGVPFCHLVPDPRMLPAESLRLFRVDTAWVAALVAGARDAGISTTRDATLDRVLRDRVALARAAAPLDPAGLLISSELVAAWPEFEIIATGRDGRNIPEARRAHLGGNVLMVLYGTTPDKIALREPGAGIHFGIDAGDRISLRDLDPGPGIGAPLREEFPDPSGTDTVFTRYLRSATGRTRDVLDLRPDSPDALVQQLARALDRPTLTPSQFALELVNARLEQLLLPDGALSRDSAG